MCSTPVDDGPRLVTNIAPVTVPDDITTPRAMKEKLTYIVDETMRALGMGSNQMAGCGFVDPDLLLQDGNQYESDLINFQRIIIEAHGYKVVGVDRLDAGAAAKKSIGTPPPDRHEDGAPLRFYYVVGLVPTAADTRNPLCISNVVTLEDRVDWKEWGSSGRADSLTERFKEPFLAACARRGEVTSSANAHQVYDRGDGQFVYQPHPTDRKVTLTP